MYFAWQVAMIIKETPVTSVPEYKALGKKLLSTSKPPLSTSENVLFPGHNHLLTTGADDATLSLYYCLSASEWRVISTGG